MPRRTPQSPAPTTPTRHGTAEFVQTTTFLSTPWLRAVRRAATSSGFAAPPGSLPLWLHGVGGAAGDVAGQVRQKPVAGPGSRTQHLERVVRADLHPLGEHALGLLDDDPAGERQLQLPGDDLTAADGALVEDADGGGISQRLLNASAVSYLVGGGYTCVLWTSVPRDWEADAAWVDRCLADIEGQDWTVVVAHDLPTGGMAYLPALLDRTQAMGAEFVQDFPPACVPIRRGIAQADMSPIVRQARALSCRQTFRRRAAPPPPRWF